MENENEAEGSYRLNVQALPKTPVLGPMTNMYGKPTVTATMNLTVKLSTGTCYSADAIVFSASTGVSTHRTE